jgi:hypothetical protein
MKLAQQVNEANVLKLQVFPPVRILWNQKILRLFRNGCKIIIKKI